MIPISENTWLNLDKMHLLNAFLNSTSDAVYVIDLNGIVLEVNNKFEQLHEWKREEIIGREIPLRPDERIAAEMIFDRIVHGEKVTVLEAVKSTKSGGSFYTDVTIFPVFDENGVLIALAVIERDITEKKKAEERLRESEERYRVLVECSPEPIVVCQNHEIMFLNPAAIRLMGAGEASELIGMHVSRFMHPDEVEELPEPSDLTMTESRLSDRMERRLVRVDGSVIYVEVTAIMINFLGVPSMQLLLRDMTDRKKAESELALKEREFSRVIQLSPEPILLHQSGVITFVNDVAVKLLNGQAAADFIGRSVLDFFCPSYLPIILERMTRVVQTEGYLEFIELKLRRLDGELVDVEVSSICVRRDPRQPLVQLVIRDLTDRKKTEEMIRRSDKLSIAGELAAGVAHEIRNPLTSLKGFMQLLKAKKTEYVDIMLVEIDRISYIVNEFIGMAKPQARNYVECDVQSLMNEVIVFMHPQSLLYNAQIRLQADPPCLPVRCEPNQIKQVFINILKNAIESMPGGGTVEIGIQMLEDRRGVVTRIVDQGGGIPPDRLAKIGEPFFSLKESGTGLGLMVCYRIIEAHKGRIDIRSVVNEGTTIEIELPV